MNRAPGTAAPANSPNGGAAGRPRRARIQVASSRARRARIQAAGRTAWRALIQAVAGPSPAAINWRWRSERERRAAYIALGLATLALCFINASTLHGASGLHGSVVRGTIQLPPTAAQRALAVVLVLPLPLAVRRPMLAWRVGWLGLLLAPLVPAAWWGGWPWGPPQVLALLVAFCLAGIRQPRPVLWWMWALSLIPWVLWLVRDLPDLNGPASSTVIFTAVVIAVDSFGSRLRAQNALAAQTERAETERARRAVLEERARIARELHDVIAHHMSMLAIRAESAPYRIPGLSEPARAEFGSMSEVAREALADMRRMLGILRHDEPAGLAPQPRLADLPALVDAAREAGVSVELSVPAALDRVPPAVGVSAYRIVQESLTNASQHAPGAPVTVSVGHDAGAVVLRVANGPGGPPPGGHGNGHGLTGMNERAALLGGSLSAGPTPDGGFEVCAVLPLGGTA